MRLACFLNHHNEYRIKMKNDFRLVIATMLLLLPNAGRAQWLTQSFELKHGWNAIYLHVDASHTDVVGALGYDLSTIDQSPVEQVWAWVPKPNSTQFIQSPQTPVNNTSRWSEWQKDEPVSSQLKKIRGNHGYLLYVNLPTGQISHNLQIKGKPVLPRYEWTTSGLNFIGFPVPTTTSLTIPPNFDQYLVHSPELHRNGEIYLYNGGALSDGTNPARLFSLRSTKVQRGQAMWIRGVTGQFSNYFGPIKVSLQNVDGVHFGDSLGQYRVIVRNMTGQAATIKLAPVASEQPPAGEPLHVGSPPLVVRGELNTKTLKHDYEELTSAGRSWALEPKGEPGSGVEIILGLDRAKMSQIPGDRYAGLLRITDNLNDNSQSDASGNQSMTRIDVQVTATVPSLNGLWVGEALVNEVRHDLTEYPGGSDDKGDEDVIPNHMSALSYAHLAEQRSLSITGWSRIRRLPDANSMYGIAGEFDNDVSAGGYFAVNSDGKLVFAASQKSIITANHNPIRLNQWNHVAVTYTGDYKRKSVDITIENPRISIQSITKAHGSYDGLIDIVTTGPDSPKITDLHPGSFIKKVEFTTKVPHDFQLGDLVKFTGITSFFQSEFSDNSLFPVLLLEPSSPGGPPSVYKFFVVAFAEGALTGDSIKVVNPHAAINLEKIELTQNGTLMTTSLADSQMVHEVFSSGIEIEVLGGRVESTSASTPHGKIYKIKSATPVRRQIPGQEGGGEIIKYEFRIEPDIPQNIYDDPGNNLYFKKVPTRVVHTAGTHQLKTGELVNIASQGAYTGHFKIKASGPAEFEISSLSLASTGNLFPAPGRSEVGNFHSLDSGFADVAIIGDNTISVKAGDKVIISGGAYGEGKTYIGYREVVSVDSTGTEFRYAVDPSAHPPIGPYWLERNSTYVSEIREINTSTINGLARVEMLGENVFYKGDIIKITGGGNASKYNNRTFEVFDSSTNPSSINEGAPKTNSSANSYIQILLPVELIGKASHDTGGAFIEKVGEVKFYINGNAVDSYISSNDPANVLPLLMTRGGSATFLRRTGEEGDQMPGDIKELKIYGELLTEQQILSDYNRDSLVVGNSAMNIIPKAGPVDNFYQGFTDPSGAFPVSSNHSFGKVRRPYKLRLLFHRDAKGDKRFSVYIVG